MSLMGKVVLDGQSCAWQTQGQPCCGMAADSAAQRSMAELGWCWQGARRQGGAWPLRATAPRCGAARGPNTAIPVPVSSWSPRRNTRKHIARISRTWRGWSRISLHAKSTPMAHAKHANRILQTHAQSASEGMLKCTAHFCPPVTSSGPAGFQFWTSFAHASTDGTSALRRR